MTPRHPTTLTRLRDRIRAALSGPHLLAFLPAVTLGAFWLGGEGALTMTALIVPLVFAMVGGIDTRPPRVVPNDLSVVTPPERLEEIVESVLQSAAERNRRTACFAVEIDEPKALARSHGKAAAEVVLARAGERIQSAMRDFDAVRRIGDARFVIVLEPIRQLTLDTCLSLADRIQTTLDAPISVDGTSIHASCSVGFCVSNRAPADDSAALIGAATRALDEALRAGAGSVRSFSGDWRPRMPHEETAETGIEADIAAALEEGQFEPWFQPQLSTDTGRITGFEALARWIHPQKGLIPPGDFLPALEDSGRIERLGEIMLTKSLAALRKWDDAGFDIPNVAVNFSDAELRNPNLLDRVKWELDRFELTPDRLVVEVLETVVAVSPDDTTARNINALATLGCGIDLDDFGTGQASISAVRRFSVSRLKIDRSFVTKADRDPDQQRLIAAILTMADQLGLEAVAEGVETPGEHTMLAQLGCAHVQGFGIARPMPFSDTLDWIGEHNRRRADAPHIGRAAG